MKQLRLLSWNVNGIRAIHRKGFLDWVATDPADIICLQETKAHPDQLPGKVRTIDGFYSFFASAERKGYSGVAIYSSIEPKTVEVGFGIDRFDCEGRTLVADYGTFVLLNVYFPNGNASDERLAYKMDFYKHFLDFVVELKNAGKHVVICGDVNTAHKEIDLARPKQNEKNSGFLPEERAWIDDLLAAGFIDTLREFREEPELYSWWDYKTKSRERNVGWRIDYFFASESMKKKLKDAWIQNDVMGSDHCPVCLNIAV